MNTYDFPFRQEDARKLLAAASGDAALLYIFINAGNPPEMAMSSLGMSQSRYACAAATLRQLGLWPEDRPISIAPGERPSYTEQDVTAAMDTDASFRALYGEVQRLLGKPLNTEELKILLSFNRYRGLPSEVISILVSFCKERARRKGTSRNPSLRTIEKEAYQWAEQGIDTLEEAAAYIHQENMRYSRLGNLMKILQIRGRNLTAAETKYAESWLQMDLPDELISMAYERTCLNTGGLSWAYMNKILTRWNSAGLRTAEAVRNGGRGESVPQGASGQLGSAELEAIQKILKEG